MTITHLPKPKYFFQTDCLIGGYLDMTESEWNAARRYLLTPRRYLLTPRRYLLTHWPSYYAKRWHKPIFADGHTFYDIGYSTALILVDYYRRRRRHRQTLDDLRQVNYLVRIINNNSTP